MAKHGHFHTRFNTHATRTVSPSHKGYTVPCGLARIRPAARLARCPKSVTMSFITMREVVDMLADGMTKKCGGSKVRLYAWKA